MSKTLSPLQAELVSARASLKFFKGEVAYLAAKVKAEKANGLLAKEQAAEAKRIAAIAKAQARLDRLLSKSVGAVGAKAIKANKRPSKAVTYGAEANDLAAKIKAGVSTI
jgi:Tfp pilus assembly protein PilN